MASAVARWFSIVLSGALCVGCGRSHDQEVSLPQSEHETKRQVRSVLSDLGERETRLQVTDAGRFLRHFSEATSLKEQIDRLREGLLRAENEEIASWLDRLVRKGESEVPLSLRAIFYEETKIRPEWIRWPAWLVLAQDPQTSDGLRNTIVAEIGSRLQADHGFAWDVWAESLEAYLRDRHGLMGDEGSSHFQIHQGPAIEKVQLRDR